MILVRSCVRLVLTLSLASHYCTSVQLGSGVSMRSPACLMIRLYPGQTVLVRALYNSFFQSSWVACASQAHSQWRRAKRATWSKKRERTSERAKKSSSQNSVWVTPKKHSSSVKFFLFVCLFVFFNMLHLRQCVHHFRSSFVSLFGFVPLKSVYVKQARSFFSV